MTGRSSVPSQQRSQRDETVLERRLASVFRALSGDPGVDLWAHRPVDVRGTLPMNAPHLYPDPHTSGLDSLRGATDAMAVRHRFSDLDAHRAALPEAREQRLLVEILEQYRCESLAVQSGVRGNLALRQTDWRSEFLRSRLHETHLGMLLFTVILVVRATLTREPITPSESDLIEESRFEISADLGPFLPRLQETRHDQSAFAEVARQLARTVADRITALEERESTRSGARERRVSASLPLVFDVAEELFAPAGETANGRLHLARDYRAWDTGFDRTSHITDLVRYESLRSGRRAIAEETARRAVPLAPVVTRLHNVVDAVREAHEAVDADEGLLDPSRLTRLLTSPGDPRVFRGRSQRSETDCAVTFLLDLSGSMKPHARRLGALLDVIVTALDRLGVSTEVLGFTTNAWSGGRVRRAWKKAGSPADPGRLNEVHHIVLKAAGSSWRRSRTHLGGLLKTSLFREGIDAEALRWAVDRLRSQQAAKSAVVVISDGLPADSATGDANDEHYLARDLEATVARLRRAGDVGVVGVGVGADPSVIYPVGVELDADDLGDGATVRALVDALRTVLGH
ncbi:cobaltochelatase CobT-related protein [Brevibacterium sp. FAM 27836]|uniref:cobaltochelatase CobT-related protein n=1 Tax=Brevibacterium sp. FAM 27836 TaxID=3446693 RepID=UPI003F50EE3A